MRAVRETSDKVTPQQSIRNGLGPPLERVLFPGADNTSVDIVNGTESESLLGTKHDDQPDSLIFHWCPEVEALGGEMRKRSAPHDQVMS